MLLEQQFDYQRWRSEFAKALDPARYTIEYVDQMLASGRYVFDAGKNAAVLTEARVYPTGAWEVHGVLAAGDLDEIRGYLIPLVERRAFIHGAMGASIASRPGWARALKLSGYEIDQVTIRKKLIS